MDLCSSWLAVWVPLISQESWKKKVFPYIEQETGFTPTLGDRRKIDIPLKEWLEELAKHLESLCLAGSKHLIG